MGTQTHTEGRPREDTGEDRASGGPACGHTGGRLGACRWRDKGCRHVSRLSEEFVRAVLRTKSHKQTPGPLSPSQPPLQATGHSLLPSPVPGQAGRPRGPGRCVGPPSRHDLPTATGLGPSVRATLCRQPDRTEAGHRMAVVLAPPGEPGSGAPGPALAPRMCDTGQAESG